MQAPFAFDSDGNLVISAKMVEALGLGKPRESKGSTRADPGEVIRAISEEIQKRDTYPGLQESIGAIRFDQINTEAKARAEADSALADDLSALESRMGDTESTLDAEQQARADGDSTLAEGLAALNSRLDSESTNWRTELEALRKEVVARHDASEADVSSLEVRMSDLEARIEELARKAPGA